MRAMAIAGEIVLILAQTVLGLLLIVVAIGAVWLNAERQELRSRPAGYPWGLDDWVSKKWDAFRDRWWQHRCGLCRIPLPESRLKHCWDCRDAISDVRLETKYKSRIGSRRKRGDG